MRVVAIMLVFLSGLAVADEPPKLTLVPPPIDPAALEARGKRKFQAGMALAAGGGLVGGASLALMLVPLLRPCAAGDPSCARMDVASSVVGAVGLALVAVGATLFAVGTTERRIARLLRNVLFCSPQDQRQP